MRHSSLLAIGIVAALASRVGGANETGPVGPADYPEIARLLREPLPERVAPVRFEDLWQDPTGGAGRAVRVSGVSRRAFRQPAGGKFPALVELWLTDEAGNPIGLMFPDQPGMDWIGRQMVFQGRVLRLVEYRDGAGVRRAPLIVGPEFPNMTAGGPVVPGEPGRFPGDWVLGGMLLLFVAVVLGLQHARRPRRGGRSPGPRPQFEDPTTEKEPGAADG